MNLFSKHNQLRTIELLRRNMYIENLVLLISYVFEAKQKGV